MSPIVVVPFIHVFVSFLCLPCAWIRSCCACSILRFIVVTFWKTGAFFKSSGNAMNRILLPLKYTFGSLVICPFRAVLSTSERDIFIVSSALNKSPRYISPFFIWGNCTEQSFNWKRIKKKNECKSLRATTPRSENSENVTYFTSNFHALRFMEKLDWNSHIACRWLRKR